MIETFYSHDTRNDSQIQYAYLSKISFFMVILISSVLMKLKSLTPIRRKYVLKCVLPYISEISFHKLILCPRLSERNNKLAQKNFTILNILLQKIISKWNTFLQDDFTFSFTWYSLSQSFHRHF